MEDIINALLDVVRAQHSAAEGTDAAPFDMDDIVDMALNLLGRPEDKSEEEAMVDNIQKTVESMAPDIFPPKTFEQMDDSEKVASAANMIENRFMRSNQPGNSPASSAPEAVNPSSYSYETNYDDADDQEESTESAGDLNDLIYKNFMSMMGLSTPQVEYPFDRSQIVYGKEKSITEQLAEEEEEKKRAAREEAERNRKLSAWELAQNAIDSDEAAHEKESYIPPQEAPVATKSASQMAAEAIRQSQEQDRMRQEAEKQAEAIMAEAKRRGQDPMEFMMHQQEVLDYMERNSDELVSYEDYEDLSPEEKLEIERQVYIEHQIADGVDPDQVDRNVPEAYIPEELKGHPQTAAAATEEPAMSTFDDDTLRALASQVIGENSDMILSENGDEDMSKLQEELFENLKKMMAGSGTAVPQENVAALLSQAAANQMQAFDEEDAAKVAETEVTKDEPQASAEPKTAPTSVTQAAQKAESQRMAQPMSAVELARAAQAAAKPAPKEAPAPEVPEEKEEELDLSFDELDDMFEEDSDDKEASDKKAVDKETFINRETSEKTAGKERTDKDSASEDETAAKSDESDSAEDILSDEDVDDLMDDLLKDDVAEENMEHKDDSVSDASSDSEAADFDDDEYEYVDDDELVLGEHTQAEIDEALDNLASLGLEGEVYERAKRMILLELAGSEVALEAWLYEQENSKKKKKAVKSALDEDNLDDLSDFDEDLFEKELDMAIDKDFEEKVSETVADDEPESEESAAEEAESEEFAAEEAESEEFGSEESGSAESEPEQDEASDIEVEELPDEEILVEKTSEPVVEEISEVPEEKAEVNEKKTKAHRGMKGRKSVVHKKEKSPEKKAEKASKEAEAEPKQAEERGYQVSVRKPFVLKNSTSFMDKFEDFITENQENRRLSTGFRKLDGMLRFGLHKGSYFVDSQPQYLKNAFMQQIADRSAESGVDVLFISTELSRYDIMVDTISRLSYEMNGHDAEKAHSVMSIMTGEDGATLECLEDELNWYRGRLSEHLFILDQEAVDEYIDSTEETSAGAILEELIRSIVREGAHKPVVFIDNIENILSVEDSEDMKPLMDGIRQLSKELSIPIVMSYGYAQAESEDDLSVEEQEFHQSLGNMCDVYLELRYADMITEDSVELTEEDIREMAEDGDTLLIDVMLHKNRRPMRASCQIQSTPKYNFFEE